MYKLKIGICLFYDFFGYIVRDNNKMLILLDSNK